MGAQIIAGTILLIFLFLLLNQDAGNAAKNVLGSIGTQFVSAVTVLQGRNPSS